MLAIGLSEDEIKEAWAPMIEFLEQRPNDYTHKLSFYSFLSREFWDVNFLMA